MMKNIKYTISTLALTSILASSVVFADTAAIGPKIGTQGVGVDGRVELVEDIYVRLGGNYLKVNHLNYNEEEFNFRGKLRLLSLPLMIDLHPIKGSGFKVSLGMAYNGNRFTFNIKSKAIQTITEGGNVLIIPPLGNAKGILTLGNSIGGIAAVGFDNSLIKSGSLSFNFEAGVMYAGNPKVKLTANGVLNKPKEIQAFEKHFNKSVKKVKIYQKLVPILSIGMRYSF